MAGSDKEMTTCPAWVTGSIHTHFYCFISFVRGFLKEYNIVRYVRFPNPVKFPHGIAQLVKEVNALGCRFGIWFEPEMISEESVRFFLLLWFYCEV